ncbi:LysR family transcriptional regulator [Pannonibacter sp. Pt2-lr]
MEPCTCAGRGGGSRLSSAAGKALGLTQPTVGRQIAALEQELGLVLVERTGRTLVLTETGRQLVEAARSMAEAGLRLSLVASGQAQAVAGPVSISASDMFAHYLLPPVLRHLHAIAPGLEIELICSNEISDLKRREADIAVRHVRPEGRPDRAPFAAHERPSLCCAQLS